MSHFTQCQNTQLGGGFGLHLCQAYFTFDCAFRCYTIATDIFAVVAWCVLVLACGGPISQLSDELGDIYFTQVNR